MAQGTRNDPVAPSVQACRKDGRFGLAAKERDGHAIEPQREAKGWARGRVRKRKAPPTARGRATVCGITASRYRDYPERCPVFRFALVVEGSSIDVLL